MPPLLPRHHLFLLPALASVTIFTAGTVVQAAPPANDNLAAAVLLTGPSPAVVANNLEATLETGEFSPRQNGGASVWYRWVAPTSGWHEATTLSNDPAHDLDTLLILYRAGGDVATMPRMGFNDEAGQEGQSRLVFHTNAGQEYVIAVHGHEGEVGTFRLALAPVAPPSIRVLGADFDPATVDVGATAASSSGGIHIQSDHPFVNAEVTLLHPGTDSHISTAFVESADRTSGTEFDGVYPTALTVQAYRPPGMYPVVVYSWDPVADVGFQWSTEGGNEVQDEYLIPGAASLNVLNTGAVDSDPPVLTGVSGIPATVDLTTGEVEVELTVHVSDALSGLMSGEIIMRLPGDSWEIGSFDAGDLSAGTAQNGTYVFNVRFRDYLPLGTLNIEYDLRDNLGNRVRYGNPNGPPVPAGMPASIQITATPPANDNFASSVLVVGGDPPIIEGSTRFATRQSGEPALGDGAGGSVWYHWQPPYHTWVSMNVSSEDQDQALAVFTGATLESLQEIGRNDGSIRDSLGQRQPLVFWAQPGLIYRIAVCANTSFSTGAPFALEIANTNAQPALRVLNAFMNPDVVDAGAGAQNVSVYVEVNTDTAFLADSSGPGWLRATLRPDPSFYSGPPVSADIYSSHRISGDAFLGAFQVTLTLPPYLPPGKWDLVIEGGLDYNETKVWTLPGTNPVADANVVSASPDQIQIVNTGIIDTQAPVLTAFSGVPSTVNIGPGPVGTTIQLAITDQGGGFTDGNILLISTGAGPIYLLGQISAANRVLGNALNGVYQIPYTFTETMTPGRYRISIGLNDVTGYSSSFGPNFFDQQPIPGSSGYVEIIDVATGYAAWAASQNFGPSNLGAPGDDPNKDGISNLLCYAFNLPPNGPPARPLRPGMGDLSGLPAIQVVGSGATRRLRIEYLRRQDVGNNLTYTTQFGDGLVVGGPGGLADAAGGTTTETIDGTWQRVFVDDPVSGASRRFGRVGVLLGE